MEWSKTVALLPSMQWVIQQSDGTVSLFSPDSMEEIVHFDPRDADAAARAQRVIYDSPLGEEDKCFAHFWSGYFYAHAQGL